MLVVLNLALAVYLCRGWILEPILRRWAGSELGRILQADVEIGAIEGSWWNGLVAREIEVRDGRTALVDLEAAELRAALSLPRLLRGDLGGCRRVHLRAAALTLDVAGATAEPAEPSSSPPPSLAWVGELAPAGLTIRVGAVHLKSPHGDKTVRDVAIRLHPGQGERELDLRGEQVEARWLIDPAAGRATASAALSDPGAWLRALGVANRVRAGHLRLQAEGVLRPVSLRGQLDLADARYRGRDLSDSRIAFALDDRELSVPSAELDLPGLQVHGHGLHTPSPFTADGNENLLATLAGVLDVIVIDAAPYAGLLPQELRSLRRLLPASGRLRARVSAGDLLLEALQIDGNGIHLQSTGGRMALGPRLEDARVDLAFEATASQPQRWELDNGTELVLAGSAAMRMRGSLPRPELTGDLDLGPGGYGQLRWSQLRGQARWTDRQLEVRGLDAAGVTLADAATPSELRGDMDLAWSDARTTVRVDATAVAHPGWLDRLAMDLRGLAPRQPTEIRLRGTAALGADRPATARGHLELPNLTLGERPPVQVAADLALDRRGVLSLAPLRLRGGLELDVEGSVPIVHLAGPLDLHVIGRAVDIVTWGGAAAASLPRGQVDLWLGVRGTWADPALDTRIEAALLDWPAPETVAVAPTSPVRFAISARGHLGVGLGPDRRLLLSSTDLAAAIDADGHAADGTAMALRADVIADDRGVHVALDDLRVGPGSGSGELKLGLQPAQLLDADGALWSAPLAGAIQVEALSLAELPLGPTASGLGVEGIVTGNLRLDGTLAKPAPQLALRLRDGAIAVPAGPRLRDVTAAIRGTPRQLEIEQMSAAIGAGHVALAGELRAHGAAFSLRDPTTSELAAEVSLVSVDLHDLVGEPRPDLLLRGLVRGTVSVRGTLAAPSVTGEVVLADGSVAIDGTKVAQHLRLRTTLTAERVEVRDLAGRTVAGGTVAGRASIAGDLLQLIGDSHALDEATLDGTFTIDGLDLAGLPVALAGINDLAGTATVRADLTGTFAQPKPTATVTLRGAVIKPDQLPRVDGIEGQLAWTGSELRIDTLAGRMGAGRIEIEGLARAPGDGPMRLPDDDWHVQADVRGHDALVYRDRGIRVRADPALQLRGTLGAIRVTGSVDVASAKLVRRVSLIPDLRARGRSAEAATGLALPALPAAIGDRLRFDVGLQTRTPFEARTNVLTAKLEAVLRLRGTGTAPYLVGNVSGQDGRLSFPGANLNLNNIVLSFSSDQPAFPDVLVQGTGKRHGIHVFLTVKGRYDNPEVLLTSSPPVPPQDLVVLVTTGALPATLRNMGAQGQATLIGSYLAEEIFYTMFGSDSTEQTEGLIDRFHVESGREISRNGEPTLLFEFDLNREFALQAEQDVYEDFNMGVVYRLRF